MYGTATAASVWATGAVGAAMAFGRVEIAVVISAITFATLRWITPLTEHVEEHTALADGGDEEGAQADGSRPRGSPWRRTPELDRGPDRSYYYMGIRLSGGLPVRRRRNARPRRFAWTRR